MTRQAARFTPEVLISAPRRGPGSPNCTGEAVLYTVSRYSLETHSKTTHISLLDVKTGFSSVLTGDSSFSEPVWIGEHEILFLDSGTGGSTGLVTMDVRCPSITQGIQRINGSISNLKAKRISDDEIVIACSAITGPDGVMYHPSRAREAYSSAKVYSGLFARHWDSWKSENRNSVWYGRIKKRCARWVLETPGLVNVLGGTKLECPIPPFGGTGHFDISASGIAFVARDPKLCPAEYTKSDLYYVPVGPFTFPSLPAPQAVETRCLLGYTIQPTFSNCGRKIAFARMRHMQYEADKTRLMLIPDVEDLGNVHEFHETEDGEGAWDFSPASILWSHDDSELYFTAERHGKEMLWKTSASPAKGAKLPEPIYERDSVMDLKPLCASDSRIFLTTASLVDSSCYSILDPATKNVTVVSSATKHGKSLGLSRSQCSDFWFKGCDDRKVHALVVKPSNFDEKKKYPLAFLIHGGPQGAWSDSWSTRWNPAVFAEQGYVAVMCNPTGSTGYGQEFCDRIQCEWGGRPYLDLEKCWEFIRDTMPYVDVENGVALGASYGGYMINWIQGHPLGRKFKALVCHDGVFSTVNQWSTEELFFPLHEFGGSLWESRSVYEKWDPSRFTDNWATPMLVVHNELDYRLPISEGLAMFNVLQSKKIPSKLVMFPDENHWVLKHENSLVWHKEVLGFINKYSGVAKCSNDPENDLGEELDM